MSLGRFYLSSIKSCYYIDWNLAKQPSVLLPKFDFWDQKQGFLAAQVVGFLVGGFQARFCLAGLNHLQWCVRCLRFLKRQELLEAALDLQLELLVLLQRFLGLVRWQAASCACRYWWSPEASIRQSPCSWPLLLGSSLRWLAFGGLREGLHQGMGHPGKWTCWFLSFN